MSRLFDGTDDNLAFTASAPVSGPPLTVACWLRPTSNANGTAVGLSRNDNGNGYWALGADGSSVPFFEQGGNTGGAASTATAGAALPTTSWSHLTGVCAAANSRTCYRNGVAGTTLTTSLTTTCNQWTIGDLRLLATDLSFRNGHIAEVGVWNVALTTGEINALAKGVSPRLIRPGNLVGYVPLRGTASPEPDYTAGQRHLTVTGAAPGTTNPPTSPIWASSGLLLPVTTATSMSETPIPGVATGAGVSPAAAVSVSPVAGVSVAAGVGPTVSAAVSPVTGVAVGSGVTPTASAAASPGAATAAGVGPSGASISSTGVATVAGVAPSASVAVSPLVGVSTATGVAPVPSISVVATPGAAAAVGPGPSAAGAVGPGAGVVVGAAPSSATSAPVAPAIASAAGVSPSAAVAAPVAPGVVIGAGVSPSAVASVGVTAATAAGVAPGSRTVVAPSAGIATVETFPVEDSALDSTPTPGVVTGSGIVASSLAVATPVVGVSMTGGIEPAARVIAGIGVAASAGISPFAATTAAPGISTGQGTDASASVLVTMGVASGAGVSPTDALIVLPGVAVGVGVSPTPTILATLMPGIVVGRGITPSETSRDVVTRAGHRTTIDALERLPSGMVVRGVELVGT